MFKKYPIMKKALLLLIIVVFVSCNNVQILCEEKDDVTTEDAITALSLKIDSLNAVYSENALSCTSRGFVKNYCLGEVADAVGKYVGGRIFSWAGTAIGAAVGNPVVAAVGYAAGRKYGGLACSAAVSFGAAWVLSKCVTRAGDGVMLCLNDNYVVNIDDPNNLTDGELHNLILAKLLQNIDKYVGLDGSLNYELLLKDAYKFEYEYYSCEENISNEEYALYEEFSLPLAIEQTKKIVGSSNLLEVGNVEPFLNEVYNDLILEIKPSKLEYDNANMLIGVLPTYTILDNNTASNFEKDINNAINSSELDLALKDELQSSNSVIKNSVMIWREVEYK